MVGVSFTDVIWRNQWFGRRDVIPPISDKRTLLIDRGMVTQGLITPEELVEIHAVGDEMLKIKGDLLAAKAEAGAAVVADKAAREECKKQKKAEAAERDRLHNDLLAEQLNIARHSPAETILWPTSRHPPMQTPH